MKRSDKAKSKGGIARDKSAAEPTVSEQELRERIARKAYELYQKRGQAPGCDLEDWLEAERLVLSQLEEQRHSKIKMPRQKSNDPKRIKRPNDDKE